MPSLTRRRDPHRPDCWRIQYAGVHVGTIAKAVGNPGAAESWTWQCGFCPGSDPGDHRSGSAPTFDAARAAFDAAWREYLPKRTEADFQEWRDQEAWNAEKYRGFARGERMPTDWRPHG
jgi:hypothetical protein